MQRSGTTSSIAVAVLAVLASRSPVAAGQSAASQLGAKYALDGDHDQKGFFSGDATISKSGSKWTVKANVRYSSGARETREGEGTLAGDSFTVAFTVTSLDSASSFGASSSSMPANAKPYRLNVRYSLRSLDVLQGVLEKTNGWNLGAERLRRPGLGLILVIANRQWEVEHLIKAFAKSSGRPKEIDAATVELIYHPDGAMYAAARRPRCRFRCDGFEVEVWCVEDLTRAAPTSAKLSRAKWDAIPRAFAGEGGDPKKPRAPRVVVTFGSGAGTKTIPNNGSVAVGRAVFVHDPYHPTNSYDPWGDELEKLVSSGDSKLLDGLDSVRDQVEPDFERPPVTAGTPRLYFGDDLVAIGEVNVDTNKDYVWADPETVETFSNKVKNRRIASVDTAHGLYALRTRSLSSAPTVFVSAILNRMGDFEELDADPKNQTRTVMSNAAATTVWLIPTLTRNVANAD